LLCLSKEVCSQWKKLYGDTLVGFTTTSLYGNKDNRQTQYDNLVPYWDNCKSTTGKTPYKFNIRLENGRVIITAEVIKNPTLDGVKSIMIDTDEEDPKINLIGGTLILNQDFLNLLNGISRSYADPQIGRNNLVKVTQSKQTPV
jgi:hypothetical protein